VPVQGTSALQICAHLPADNGSGCHQDERLFPSSPEPSQYDPEKLLRCRESPAWLLGVKSEQLLTQGKIFEEECQRQRKTMPLSPV
jgi:hypothetical protein